MLRRVVGNSMKPSLFEGDIVVARKKKNVQVGDIVIARRGKKEIIKRVKRITKNKYYLVGDNKKASTDSRDFGSVARKDILAVAVFVVGTSRFMRNKKKSAPKKLIFSAGMIVLSVIVIAGLYGNFAKSENFSNLLGNSENNAQPVANKIDPKYTVGEVKKDVPYCNDQSLDIYYPEKAVYEKAPVVMYFHGGGWRINNKSSETDQLALINDLRNEGYAIVSIDYRKLPESFFPAPVSDALCSVRYLRATTGTNGLDAEKIALYGFSAGGHLAGMVGTLDSNNQFNEGPYKEQSSRVKAVVTLAGIFSFESQLRPGYDAKIQYFLNGQQNAVAQPISYVSSDDPPFLLVHGLKDQYIAPEQDDIFAARLTEAGVQNKIVHVQNAEHGLGSVDGEAAPSRIEVGKIIRDYIKEQLTK